MTRRGFLRVGVVFGSIVTCMPVLGLLGTLIGITRTFDPWEKSGIGDSHALGGHLDSVLTLTSVGLALFPCGIVLRVVCIVLLKRLRGVVPPPMPRFVENPTGN